jgi:hypothetical protein
LSPVPPAVVTVSGDSAEAGGFQAGEWSVWLNAS